jgi:hypothetical protein
MKPLDLSSSRRSLALLSGLPGVLGLVVATACGAGCATGSDAGFSPGDDPSDASLVDGGNDGARDSHLIFEVEGDSRPTGDTSGDGTVKVDAVADAADAPDTGCPTGTTKCSTGCYDLTKDPTHCGTCDKTCATGEVCSTGTCGTVCGGGTTLCGGLCVDLTKDAAHCGSCTKACATGETCASGACTLVCGGGTTKCGASCVNTTNDPGNCGGCGVACGGAMVCIASKCEVVCGGGTTKCGTSCVDTSKDLSNCGTCGNVCPGGAAASCTGGTCGVTCSGSFANCNGSAADGCEANLDSDPANCGACGTTCGACTTCTSRSCSPSVTSFVFPSTSSSTKSGALGAGGGAAFYQKGDFVQQSFTRGICANSIDLDFTMSDYTDGCWCYVGTLHWNVIVNGTIVGSYSFPGGTSCGGGTSFAIKGTLPFASSIAPVGGAFTVRLEATDTVCSGGYAWNWVAGGTITLK